MKILLVQVVSISCGMRSWLLFCPAHFSGKRRPNPTENPLKGFFRVIGPNHRFASKLVGMGKITTRAVKGEVDALKRTVVHAYSGQRLIRFDA